MLALVFLLLSMTTCRWLRTGGCGDLWWLADSPAHTVGPQSFTSEKGRFRIGLPPLGNMTEHTDSQPDKDNRTFKWLVVNLGQYMIQYVDGDNVLENTEVNQTVFDRLRDAALSHGPAHLELDAPIRLSGHPGREVRIRDDKGLQIQRMYIAGKRAYIVAVSIPRTLECATDGAVKVLDSFEIIEENAAL